MAWVRARDRQRNREQGEKVPKVSVSFLHTYLVVCTYGASFIWGELQLVPSTGIVSGVYAIGELN